MLRKSASITVVALAAAAFCLAPAFAADMPGDQMKGMSGMQGKTMGSGAPKKMMAHKSKHKMSCYDYAWESQDMKDCLAKMPAK